MAVREARNAILIEDKSGRVSQVAIDPTETVYQGDLMKWDAANHRATKMTAAADAATFLGVSDHTNPQYTAGTLTANYTKAYTNIVQSALVRMIAGKAETLHGFGLLEMVTDAQHVQGTATAANVIGVVDPGWATVAGKTVAIGDEIKLWLKVPKNLAAFGGTQ
jgi:multidrug resistance efflux pump